MTHPVQGPAGPAAAPWPAPPTPTFAQPARTPLPAPWVRRAAMPLAWVALVAVPVAFVVLRFATETAGWLTLMYLMVGWLVFAALQVPLATLLTVRYGRTLPGAAGTWGTVLGLAASFLHVAVALALGDAGDTGPRAVPWLERVVPALGGRGDDLGVVVFVAWVGVHVAAIVAAAVEASHRAIAREAARDSAPAASTR